MRIDECPSCGSGVVFRSALSILGVCSTCQSTLLRRDSGLEAIGRMPRLAADASRVQIGTEGRFRGHPFTVVGRIQLGFEAGVRNEWHLAFDDGRSAWLSELDGGVALSFLTPLPADYPQFDDLGRGRRVRLRDRTFKVVAVEQPRCIAAEGELPSMVAAGYEVPHVNLEGPGALFASLDYSETPPLLFIGEKVSWQSLGLMLLRDVGSREPVEEFRCLRCGTLLCPRTKASVLMVCGGCGSVHDLEDERHPVLYQVALEKDIKLLIPLGSRGRLRKDDYEVIGFRQREVVANGVESMGNDYLLMSLAGSLAWLGERDGHWNLLRPSDCHPFFVKGGGREFAQHRERRFWHFEDAEGVVTHALGEFPWKIAIGERSRLRLFVDPPRMILTEQDDAGSRCFMGEYVEASEIRKAFGVWAAFPPPAGVFANQPSRWQDKLAGYWRLFGLLVLLLLSLQFLLISRNDETEAFHATVVLDRSGSEAAQEPPFVLGMGSRAVDIEARTDLEDGSVELRVVLAEVDGSGTFEAAEALNFSQGFKEGTYWSQGSREARWRFDGVPAGRYRLTLSATGEALSVGRPLTCYLTVRRGWDNWFYLFGVMGALAVLPLSVTLKHRAFEARRWQDGTRPDS
jgi:hypothetical protein